MEKIKDGSEMAKRIARRNIEPGRIVRGLEKEGFIGWMVLHTTSDPRLIDYMEHRQAQESMRQARLDTQRRQIEEDERNHPLLRSAKTMEEQPTSIVVGGSESWRRLRIGEISPEEYAIEIKQEADRMAREMIEQSQRWAEDQPPLHSRFIRQASRIGHSMLRGLDNDKN